MKSTLFLFSVVQIKDIGHEWRLLTDRKKYYESSSLKMSCVPLPWWMSKSRINTLFEIEKFTPLNLIYFKLFKNWRTLTFLLIDTFSGHTEPQCPPSWRSKSPSTRRNRHGVQAVGSHSPHSDTFFFVMTIQIEIICSAQKCNYKFNLHF